MTHRLALLCLFLAPVAFGQSRTYTVKPGDKSTAQFHAEDTYDVFDGVTKKVSGTIVANPSAPDSSSVTLTVDIHSLDTGVGLRNKEMRERYMHTPRFPVATFKSVSV